MNAIHFIETSGTAFFMGGYCYYKPADESALPILNQDIVIN
jgi:hypothetical protein